jgi:drug/metabolite transporter (DMT)-like permease
MIMAIMPLLTMVFAHYLVEGETLNRYKLIGFTLGITGVILLLGPVFEGGGREFWSGVAIFTAATCYAVNTILIKRLPRFSPMVGACGVLIMASLILFPAWLLVAHDSDSNISQDSMFSVIWLGIGPTGIATIILFAVIERAGPTFLAGGSGDLAPFRGPGRDSGRHRSNANQGEDSASVKCSTKAFILAERTRSGWVRIHKPMVNSSTGASSRSSKGE